MKAKMIIISISAFSISAAIQLIIGFDTRLFMVNVVLLAPLVMYTFGFLQKPKLVICLIYVIIFGGLFLVARKWVDDGELTDIIDRLKYVATFRGIKSKHEYGKIHDYYAGKNNYVVYGMVHDSEDLDKLKIIIEEAQLRVGVTICVCVLSDQRRDRNKRENANDPVDNEVP